MSGLQGSGMMHLCIIRERICLRVHDGEVWPRSLMAAAVMARDVSTTDGEKQVTRSGQVSGKQVVLGSVWCSITMSRVRWGR